MWSVGPKRVVHNLTRDFVRRACPSIGQPVTTVKPYAPQPLDLNSRSFSSSYAPSPLDAFRDPVDRQTRAAEPVGRSWSVKELRRKSYEDLHKLWYVLYKERNMLLTEQQLSRRRQLIFPQPERLKKVRKSMGAIKQVLGERKRKKIAEHLEGKLQEAMETEAVDMEELEIEDEKVAK